jgi:peptidoglycan/LPS O-acetylase OafA/YrhL
MISTRPWLLTPARTNVLDAIKGRVELPTGESPSPHNWGVESKSGDAIPGLTGLRFFAAFSVAIAHGAATSPRVEPLDGLMFWLQTGGGLGMTMFFVLSGFVIHYNYATPMARDGASGVAEFLWARFARLYPLFFLVVLVDVLLGSELMAYLQGNKSGEPIAAIPYFMLFIQSWIYLPGGEHSLIYQIGHDLPLTWSISTEWFFYLAYPIISLGLLFLRNVRTALIAALAWCSIWILVTTSLADHIPAINVWAAGRYGPIAVTKPDDAFWHWLLYFSPYVRIGEFILGCLVAHLYKLLQARPVFRGENLIGSCLLALALISIPIFVYVMYAPNTDANLLKKMNLNFGLAPSIAVILFCVARYKNAFARMMGTGPIVALGDASYSIYLLHMLVYFPALGQGQTLPSNSYDVVFTIVRLAFAVTLVCIISLGLYRYVEAPSRKWLRSLWNQRPPVRLIGLAVTVVVVPLLLIFNRASILGYDPFISSNMEILSATYGGNCGAPSGNVTAFVRKACNGQTACDYAVDHRILGDAAPGCGKSFVVEFVCLPSSERFRGEIVGSNASEASGSSVSLRCPAKNK